MELGILPMYALNEAYFGKSDKCLEMEKCINQMRRNITTYNTATIRKTAGEDMGSNGDNFEAAFFNTFGGSTTIGANKSLYQTKAYKRFCQLVEEQFGFYSVSFIFIPTEQPNAFSMLTTSTPDSVINPKKYLHVSKQGFRYDKKAKYCVLIAVSEGLFADTAFTDAEVLAILLHEVGHNFDASIYPMMGLFNFMNIFDMAYQDLKDYDRVPLFDGKTGKQLKKSNYRRALIFAKSFGKGMGPQVLTRFGAVGKVANLAIRTGISTLLEYILYFKMVYDKIKSLSYNYNDLFFRTIFGNSMANLIGFIQSMGAIIAEIKNLSPMHYLLMKLRDTLFGHAQEHFSDRFATMHGYGPELTSALGKMAIKARAGIIDNQIAKIPLVNIAQDALGMMAVGIETFLMMIFPTGRHPDFVTRYNSMKNILKADIEQPGIDPKAKRMILDQIKQIDKQYARYQKDAEELGGAAKMQAKLYSVFNRIFPNSGSLLSFIGGKLGINKNMNNRIHAEQEREKTKFKL